MQDIYSEVDENDNQEEVDDDEITKSAYENVIGRLFRGYVFLNTGLLFLATTLSIDLLTGGGSITLFLPFSNRVATYLPTLLEFSVESLINTALNTISLISMVLILVGLRFLRKGKARIGDLDLNGITITNADDGERERLIRQRGYINRGKQFVPVAVIIGLGIGTGITIVFGDITELAGLATFYA